ncbi:MAG: porin family protein [Pseudomonadales bacterium]|nr:porin family protein [Pseudomonadales bacterium]
MWSKLCSLLIIFTISVMFSQANAQNFRYKQDRAGKWEGSLMWRYQGDESIQGNNGSSINFDSTDRWGFTLGYNVNKHLNIHWEYSYLKPGYKAVVVGENLLDTQVINHRATMTTSNFNFTYNILSGKITPFIMAGLGWTSTDSNVGTGTGQCWWTWYGWVCDGNSYNRSDFSYNAGVGVRWELNPKLFLRASYGQQWVDMSRVKNTPNFDIGRFEVGFRI